MAIELISKGKHPTRINTAKQTNAEVCVEVVTLVCHVLMTELPVFNPSCFLLPPCSHTVFVYLFFLCPTPKLAIFVDFYAGTHFI